MSPQSHTVQVTILGMNGIVALGNNAEESASRVSTIVSFSRKKSVHASIPSFPLTKTGGHYDERDRRRGEVQKSKFMSIWGYDDDAMSEGCVLTYQTKLHPKKDGYETRTFDVNIGLVRGKETIVLGSSSLNITGPVPGMQFDLPINMVNSVSLSRKQKKFGIHRSNSFSGNIPLEAVDSSSSAEAIAQFAGDPKTKFGLDENASLRIHVTIMLTKHFDTQAKMKAKQRSVVLSQMQMAAANSHGQPIIVNTLSTESPMSSISHTIFTNEGQSLMKDHYAEELSNHTNKSSRSKHFPSHAGINGIQPTKDSSIAESNPKSYNGSSSSNSVNRKTNQTLNSRPPLPLSSLPKRSWPTEEKTSAELTVTTGVSSTYVDSATDNLAPNTNPSKSFSLKKAFSKMSTKRVNCTAPPQVICQNEKREEIRDSNLMSRSSSPSWNNNSENVSFNNFRSKSPLRKLQTQLQISSSGGNGKSSRSSSPMIMKREQNIQNPASFGKSNNSHQQNNQDVGQGMISALSAGSRREITNRANSSPMRASRGGGSQNSNSIRSSSEKYVRRQHGYEGIYQSPPPEYTNGRHSKNLISEYELIPKDYEGLQFKTSCKDIDTRDLAIQERTNIMRSPTKDGCTSVLSGPSMPYHFEEGIHPYDGKKLDQIHAKPERCELAAPKPDDGIYGIIRNGLMCNPQQQAPCSGKEYETTTVIHETPLVPQGPPMIVNVQPDSPSVGELTFTTYEREHTKSMSRSMIPVPAAFGGEGICHNNLTRRAKNDNRSWIVDEEYKNVGEGGIFKSKALQDLKKGLGSPSVGLRKIREISDERDDRHTRRSVSKSSSGTSDGRSSSYTRSTDSYRDESRRRRRRQSKGRHGATRSRRGSSRRRSYESDDYDSNEDDGDSSITDASSYDHEETRARHKKYDYDRDYDKDYRSEPRYRKASPSRNPRRKETVPTSHYRGIQ